MVFKFTLGVVGLYLLVGSSAGGSVCDGSEIQGRWHSQEKSGAEMFAGDDLLLPQCPPVDDIDDADIPEEFDSRKNWPECEDILWSVGNQGHCASCWAFAVTEVMSDRLCIATKGKKRVRFSAQDLLQCGKESAGWVGDSALQGCRGGNVAKAWNYTAANGVVSSSCVAYDYSKIPKCVGNDGDCGMAGNVSLSCVRECDAGSSVTYADDVVKPKNPCMMPRGDVKAIQKEILKNGPVAAIMKTSEDFANYMSLPGYDEVFDYEAGRALSAMNHAVKLIGWGVSVETCGKVVPYWLVANSFGGKWGRQGGFLKMTRRSEGEEREVAYMRGSCIEHSITAAYF